MLSQQHRERRWGRGKKKREGHGARGGVYLRSDWSCTKVSLLPPFLLQVFPTRLFIFHILQMKTNTPLLPQLFLLSFSALIPFLFHRSREHCLSSKQYSSNTFSNNLPTQSLFRAKLLRGLSFAYLQTTCSPVVSVQYRIIEATGSFETVSI